MVAWAPAGADPFRWLGGLPRWRCRGRHRARGGPAAIRVVSRTRVNTSSEKGGTES
jgi:hypothetical protein